MNKDGVVEYRRKNAKILERHGGAILVRDKPIEALDGMAPKVDAILVVEFPSVEATRAWYSDPNYQPLIELRQSGARVDFLLLRQLTNWITSRAQPGTRHWEAGSISV